MENTNEGTNAFKKIFGKDFIRVKLSVLWLFVMLNYIYADILTLLDPLVAQEGGIQITRGMLFFGAILMEIPIAMVVLSLVLKYKINRLANIVAGTIKTIAVFGTMFVGTPTLYYLFFAIIEMIFTSLIVWIAFRWSVQQKE